MTLVAVVVGCVSYVYATRVQNRDLREKLFLEQTKSQSLETQLFNERGQMLRATFSEELLMHVLASDGKYSELVADLKNGSQQKVGFVIHPLSEEDNLTFCKFYPISRTPSSKRFAYSFLIAEEPFAVLDYMESTSCKMPGFNEERWYLSAEHMDEPVWYTIENQGFAMFGGEMKQE